jgi:hypothetical protein
MSGRAGALVAAVLAAAAAGCGGGEDGGMPEDFAFHYEHLDGSTAPPYHREWTIRVDAGGRGSVALVPDYGGAGVPVLRRSFEPSDDEVAALYARLDEAGLLEGGLGESDDAPVGGSLDTATITADGERIEVPAFADGGTAPLSSFAEEIRGLVPEQLWQGLERRADAYAEREYGVSP